MKFICIFIILFSTFAASGQDVNTSEKKSNVAEKEMAMDHSHVPIKLPENTPIPALSLELSQDAMSGYNLILKLQRYTLMPPPPSILSMPDLMTATINEVSGFAEGHAHLYVNGNKIQRIYGENIHIPQEHFTAGINTVSITLNNHGHMYWVANDKKILATIYLDQAKNPFITYKFESFPVK